MAGLFSGPTKESASRASSSGNFKGAIKQYRRLIKDDATDHELFNDLGVALLGSGAPVEAAEASFDALLAFSEKHPGHVASHGDLALHYEDRQDMDRAISHCERALALDAEYAPARMNLIRLPCDAGRYPDSLPHLEAMAEQVAEVVVAAEDGHTQITIDGRLFWHGADATT